MKRYRAVMKIVETGGFTRASEELGYTQSAVSQMVQSLEEELGTVLFIRSKKGVVLTPDGAELLPYIKKYIPCLQGTDREAKRNGRDPECHHPDRHLCQCILSLAAGIN